VKEYADLTVDLADRVDDETQALCTEIAELPDVIRGYEQLKLGNVARYRVALEERLGRLDAAAPRA
jgi:indolepyruvate ferredoxin oxidoreductase